MDPSRLTTELCCLRCPRTLPARAQFWYYAYFKCFKKKCGWGYKPYNGKH